MKKHKDCVHDRKKPTNCEICDSTFVQNVILTLDCKVCRYRCAKIVIWKDIKGKILSKIKVVNQFMIERILTF